MATMRNSDHTPAKLPVFDGTSYERWVAQMKVVFRYQGVLDIVRTGVTPLPENPTEAARTTHREQTKKDDKAIYFIHQCVDSNVLEKIIDYETAKEAWDMLATTYAGDDQTKKVKLMAMRRQLGLLQMETNETVAQFVNRLITLVNQMKSCGEVITESMKVEKILTGVTPNFDGVVSAIEQARDLSTLKVEQVLGSLEAYELKMKNRDGIKKEERDSDKALFAANQKKNSDSWKNKRGKGKWKNKQEAGGSSKNENHKKEGESSGKGKKKSKENIQCYNCQKFGHYADECNNPKAARKRNEEAQFARDSDDDEAVMLMAIVNEQGIEEWWYLDTGCSNHMTGHRDWFCEIDETVRRSIKFGDGRSVMAKGIGKVSIRRVDGSKVVISDVLYVPNLESNMLSLGQLLEKGFSMYMHGDHMEVTDVKGKCVLKVPVSKNRTFKVVVKSIEQNCLTAQFNDSALKWHRRMGHLNFNSLIKLHKKKMVAGLPSIEVPKEVCGK